MRCSRGILLARLGRNAEAIQPAKAGLDEYAKLTAGKNAPANVLMQASEYYRTIEPVELRNLSQAVVLAERNVAAGQETEPFALYLLAMAYNAAGQQAEAKQTADRALALIAPPRGKLVSYMRTDLEAIR
jgi:tetratricopeptide (TPR) repeat protein